MDELTDISNDLAKQLRSAQCDNRKLQHAQAITTAHINPWLAAKQLQLGQCTRLVTAGDVAMIQQCQPMTINFETVLTKCGPTLRIGDSTAHPNGFELIPFTPCAMYRAIVFISGAAYKYNGTHWEKQEPRKILQHHDLAHLYNYGNYPAATILDQYNNILLDQYEQLNSIKDLPDPGSWWAAIHKTWSYWDTIIFSLIILGSVPGAILLLMLLSRLGVLLYLKRSLILITHCLCCCCRWNAEPQHVGHSTPTSLTLLPEQPHRHHHHPYCVSGAMQWR
jgi:hypothetical protein